MPEPRQLQRPREVQRTFAIARAQQDDDDKDVVELSISSETPIEDWPGEFFILDHSPDAVRMERISSAGVGRDRHYGDQVCAVERAELVDRKLKVAVRFCSGQRAQEIKTDVLNQTRRNVSIDARIKAARLEEERDDGSEVWRATDWEPIGFAFEPYPADISVGVGRAHHSEKSKRSIHRMPPEETNTPAAGQTMSLADLRREIEQETRQRLEREIREEQANNSNKEVSKRIGTMLELARKHNRPELADKAISEAWSMEKFQRELLDAQASGNTPAGQQDPDVARAGMSDQEARQFSIMRACRLLVARKPLDGIEREASDAVAKKLGRETDGFFLPAEVLEIGMPLRRETVAALARVRGNLSRAMTAWDYDNGGSFIPTDQMGFIELLRNKQVVARMGARFLDGLVGDVDMPEVTGGSTIEALSEEEEITDADLDTGGKKATPHRLGAQVNVTKQFLAQTTLDAEGLLRDDLSTQAAIKRDYWALQGTGANGQPVGIVNTTGVNSITFGAAATYTKVVSMESAVDTDNALMGSLGYATTPTAKGKWKTKTVDAGSGQFIWTPDNTVNGYQAMSSAQIASNLAIFGNWAELLLCGWAGMDVTVDPYTLAAKDKIRIILNQYVDNIIRHAVSFCVSTDSAAQ